MFVTKSYFTQYFYILVSKKSGPPCHRSNTRELGLAFSMYPDGEARVSGDVACEVIYGRSVETLEALNNVSFF